MKWAIRIGGGVVGLILLAIIVLSLMFPEEKLRAMVVEQVAKSLNRSLEIEDASLVLWPPLGVRLEGISLGNRQDPAFSKLPMITVDRFVLKVKAWELIASQTVSVQQIVIDGLSFRYEVDSLGRTNLDDLTATDDTTAEVTTEKSTEPATLPGFIDLEEFRITGASVIVRDASSATSLDLPSIDLMLSVSADTALKDVRIDGTLSLQDFSASFDGTDLGPYSFDLTHSLKANIPDEKLAFELAMNMANIPLKLAGSVSGFGDAPALDIRFSTGTVQLTDILAAIPAWASDESLSRMEAGGTLSADISVVGTLPKDSTISPLETLIVRGDIGLANVRIAHPDLPIPVENVGVDIHLTNDSLIVRRIGLTAGGTSLSLTATLVGPLGDDPLLKAMNLVGHTDLSELKNIVELPDSVEIAGEVDIDISISGRLNVPEAMRVDGSVLLTGIMASTPDLPVPITDLKGSLIFSNNLVNLSNLSLTMGRSDIALSASIKRPMALLLEPSSNSRNALPSARFTLRSSFLDLDELIPVSEEEEIESEEMTDSTLIIDIPEMPDINFRGDIHIAKGVMSEVPLRDFNVNVTFANKILRYRGGGKVFDGTISTNATLNITRPERARWNVGWDFANVESNSALSTLTSFKDKLFLPLNTKGTLSGTGNYYVDLIGTMMGSLNFSGGPGELHNTKTVKKVGGALTSGLNRVKSGLGNSTLGAIDIEQDVIKIQTMPGVFDIEDGKLILRDLNMTYQGHEWNVEGYIGFDGSLNLDPALTLSTPTTRQTVGPVASMLGSFVNTEDIMGVLEPRDHLRINLPITGTTDDPQVGSPDILGLLMGTGRRLAEQKARAVAGRAEAEVRRRAEEARQRAEAEVRRAAEETRRRAEQEARRVAEEARRRAEEQTRRAEEEAKARAAAAAAAKNKVRGLFGR